jgi:hypothetical protein
MPEDSLDGLLAEKFICPTRFSLFVPDEDGNPVKVDFSGIRFNILTGGGIAGLMPASGMGWAFTYWGFRVRYAEGGRCLDQDEESFEPYAVALAKVQDAIDITWIEVVDGHDSYHSERFVGYGFHEHCPPKSERQCGWQRRSEVDRTYENLLYLRSPRQREEDSGLPERLQVEFFGQAKHPVSGVPNR